MNHHQELITQIALLRFKAQISYQEHQHTKEAFELTRSFIERGYFLIHKEGAGELHTHYEEDRLKGYMMVWRQKTSWYGASLQCCTLDFDWTNPQAVIWATQKLLEIRPKLDLDCELMLSARYGSILGVALSTGLGIDSVILLGHPQKSLQLLVDEFDPPKQLGHLNLDIRPIQNRREVDHIIRLKKDYFTAHPEFCWFGAYDDHLIQHRQELERAVLLTKRGKLNKNRVLDEKQKTHIWVIYRGKTFLGNFSYTIQSASPLWGNSAGLDIMLHPLIQKKSVVKTVYRIMLESMIEQGIEIYKGGTAQPAVMGLGIVMKRPLFSWVLRKNTAFLPEHFGLYLPDKTTTLQFSTPHL